MKKIDNILSGAVETYASKISRLENALLPFAQWAAGVAKPYYMGFAAQELNLGTCGGCNGLHFFINEECVATYFPDNHTASVTEGEPFALQETDHASIETLIHYLKASQGKSEEEQAFEGMPDSLQRILRAIMSEGVEVHRIRVPKN